MNDTPSRSKEWRHAWKVVASATMGYGAGTSVFIMTAGLFVRPMQQDLGWSTAAVTIVPIVHVTMSLCNPFAGVLVDRCGARRIGIMGLLLLASAVLGLAFVPPDRIALYLLVVTVGVVAPLSSAVPFLKGVASWFTQNAGAAFGIAASGASLVALVAIPLVSAMIYNFGWRAGYLTIAGIILLLALPPVLLWFRERPRTTDRPKAPADESGSSLREAVHRPQYWLLVTAIAVASIPVGGFLIHLVPLLGDGGISITAATSLGVVFAMAVSIGRIGGGLLLDRFHAGKVAAAMLLAACAGAVLLGVSTPATSLFVIGLAVALIGMGQGVESDLIAYFTFKLFGLRTYSTIFGTVAMVAGLAMALGGSAFALCRDFTGSYLLAMQIGAVCYAVAGLIFLGIFAAGMTRAGTAVRRLRAKCKRTRHGSRSLRRSRFPVPHDRASSAGLIEEKLSPECRHKDYAG